MGRGEDGAHMKPALENIWYGAGHDRQFESDNIEYALNSTPPPLTHPLRQGDEAPMVISGGDVDTHFMINLNNFLCG